MIQDDSAEDDRRRVARELHDDIGQRLALLADGADLLCRQLRLDDAGRHQMGKFVQEARHLSEDVRRISHALHPSVLEDLGVAAAIRSLSNDFANRTGLSVSFSESDVPRDMPLAFTTELYRITQEALRNISKHAGLAAVRVTLASMPEEIVLTIADTGNGFASSPNPGLGLISMRERANRVGGCLTVTSHPGKGTTVQVRLPMITAYCATNPFSTA